MFWSITEGLYVICMHLVCLGCPLLVWLGMTDAPTTHTLLYAGPGCYLLALVMWGIGAPFSEKVVINGKFIFIWIFGSILFIARTALHLYYTICGIALTGFLIPIFAILLAVFGIIFMLFLIAWGAAVVIGMVIIPIMGACCANSSVIYDLTEELKGFLALS